MRKLIVLLSICLGVVTACEKDTTKPNAEVISFNPDKCGCCWGWTIKKGWREIYTDNLIVGDVVGFDIDESVPVYIELGDKDDSCPKSYEIKRIVKID